MSRIILDKYIVNRQMDLLEAMKMIDENQNGVVFVVNEKEELIGSLTNGDIRRRLLSTGNLYALVEDVMNLSPVFLQEGEELEAVSVFEKAKIITGLPVVDKNKKIIDIIFRVEIDSREKEIRRTKLAGIPVVIMAGGKGTRLYPYTKILPKPLIPIGDIPIVERILRKFEAFGVTNFYMSVNYKKEMIKSYFAEVKGRYKIEYVEEDKPLGTGGSLKLIDKTIDTPIIVTNCDILIDADYSDIYRHHKLSGNAMTIVAASKNITIPYGVLHAKDSGMIMEMEEKPQLSYFVNTGMYIINPEVLERIPNDRLYHMTDLAEDLMRNQIQVGMYPIKEDAFLDMGEFEEMRRMEERIQMKSE